MDHDRTMKVGNLVSLWSFCDARAITEALESASMEVGNMGMAFGDDKPFELKVS